MTSASFCFDIFILSDLSKISDLNLIFLTEELNYYDVPDKLYFTLRS